MCGKTFGCRWMDEKSLKTFGTNQSMIKAVSTLARLRIKKTPYEYENNDVNRRSRISLMQGYVGKLYK